MNKTRCQPPLLTPRRSHSYFVFTNFPDSKLSIRGLTLAELSHQLELIKSRGYRDAIRAEMAIEIDVFVSGPGDDPARKKKTKKKRTGHVQAAVDEMQLRGIASDCIRLLLPVPPPKDEPEEVQQRDLNDDDDEEEEEREDEEEGEGKEVENNTGSSSSCWVKRLTARVRLLLLLFFFFPLKSTFHFFFFFLLLSFTWTGTAK